MLGPLRGLMGSSAGIRVEPLPCNKKLALLDLYVTAANHQANVTNRLGTWAWDRVRFRKILREAEDAREDCERAKRALKLHCDEHGC